MFVKKEDIYFAAAAKHSTIRNNCASPWAAVLSVVHKLYWVLLGLGN